MFGRFLTRNPGLKIGALAVSLILWFHIATERDGYERVLEVPLVIEGVRGGHVVAVEVPTTAQVLFRGKGKPLLFLSWRSVAVIADAADIQTRGTRTLRLENVRYPESADLQAVEVLGPDRITIEIDREITVDLPIVPLLDIREAPGHTLVGRAVALPGSVSVTGPESLVSRLTAVPTDTVRMRRARRPVDLEVLLQQPAGFNVRLGQVTVRVTQDIQQLGERAFTAVPVVLRGAPTRGRFLAQPRTVQVTVTGGRRVLESLAEDAISLFVDLGGRVPDALTPLDPVATLPEGVTLIRIEPPRIRVTEY